MAGRRDEDSSEASEASEAGEGEGEGGRGLSLSKDVDSFTLPLLRDDHASVISVSTV